MNKKEIHVIKNCSINATHEASGMTKVEFYICTPLYNKIMTAKPIKKKTTTPKPPAWAVPLLADMASIKTDVAMLKTDVAMLKTDVATLKTDVSMLKGEVNTINAKLKRNGIK